MKVGLLWRTEWDPVEPGAPIADTCRLHAMFAAFAELGITAEAVVYSDEAVDAVLEQLLGIDGVLVWVNPIEQGRDRSRLDALLHDVAAAGTWVSAHPDVILKMATKQVLVDTAAMSWSTETRRYRTVDELRSELPARLAAAGPLVLKQHRGMGGAGVWKVEADPGRPDRIRVQHATKGAAPETSTLETFVGRCEPYFADGAAMVEQRFQTRLDEGMIRVYLSHDRVVGFAHQYPSGLADPEQPRPASKVFELPDAPAYASLRARMESEWVSQLMEIVGVDRDALPVIWDADFLYGPKTPSGEDTFVLCEINASSTFAFPEHAMPAVARAAIERIGA